MNGLFKNIDNNAIEDHINGTFVRFRKFVLDFQVGYMFGVVTAVEFQVNGMEASTVYY